MTLEFLDVKRGSSGPPETAREKIRGIEELARMADETRAAGGEVVLAHGVFDLLHMGHVRHLEAARAEGDLLIVTLTADRYVNKGPGRPIFPEMTRAEMVAALSCVSGVGISNWSTAEGVLRFIRPSILVKGQDYANEDDDITGGIRRERELVESFGGRVVFTDDITDSSSSLINRHLNVYDSEVHEYLNGLRQHDVAGRVVQALEGIQNHRVLMVGEAIIDEYQYAAPMGKSAKENIIASRYEGREVFAGGVIASANHVASFVEQVDVITCIGEEDSYEDLILDTVVQNVNVHFVRLPGVPTIRKCRFVDPGHMRKLFEVYHFDDTPLSGRKEDELCSLIAERAADFDLVVVNDFGHGMMTPRSIDQIIRRSKFLAVNAQSNSANHGYNPVNKYAKADYVCIDAPEARLAVRDRFSEVSDLVQGPLRELIECNRIIVTHGQHGCITFDSKEGLGKVPAFTRQVVDTVGAGDAFLSVTAPLVQSDVNMELVGLIGNAVGAMKVGIVGHRSSVQRVPLMKFLTALLK
ncbi:MAG: adenylyltransferase/cytidyltransferase family protein [Rhodospirillaceae bacterium]|jgi:rfaE bifunctional protein nucleotidyltransferase chain/domain|nr:adenylyltransferase/cytidyltransferase family protein [Rhodospirillaceae bacterium]MBT4688898.1 adenylyltransferase/cytidyltransferase family protein [Rhodospirillaceae bacterium]MBT5083242.1 adenylyltransferase/cytidyltransferase family protein [Rhodospirillaceae bacterium]MBT5523463.1 adenylyltransferase/cytidyltransferase family protein [Rhodospirillaceae bacterium]MBT5878570.1 adenylyltransferase/cytidyltransferase family protein [Rhodospirillaceae bacterium]